MIQAVNINASTVQNQNVGETEGYGVDFSTKWDAASDLSLGISYGYLRQNNISNPNLMFINSPVSKVFIFAFYDVSDRWTLLPSAELVTDRFVTTAGDSVSGYALYHLKATYKMAKQLVANLGVRNILDKNYEIASGYPEEGRNYFVEIKYTLF